MYSVLCDFNFFNCKMFRVVSKFIYITYTQLLPNLNRQNIYLRFLKYEIVIKFGNKIGIMDNNNLRRDKASVSKKVCYIEDIQESN